MKCEKGSCLKQKHTPSISHQLPGTGNLLLERLSGAHLRFSIPELQGVVEKHQRLGRDRSGVTIFFFMFFFFFFLFPLVLCWHLFGFVLPYAWMSCTCALPGLFDALSLRFALMCAFLSGFRFHLPCFSCFVVCVLGTFGSAILASCFCC